MTFEELVEEYARPLRAHTRAVWMIAGELEYPEEEAMANGRHAQAVLREARKAKEANRAR